MWDPLKTKMYFKKREFVEEKREEFQQSVLGIFSPKDGVRWDMHSDPVLDDGILLSTLNFARSHFPE